MEYDRIKYNAIYTPSGSERRMEMMKPEEWGGSARGGWGFLKTVATVGCSRWMTAN